MLIDQHGWQGLKGNAIALIAGALLPVAFAPFNFYPLAIVSLALLFGSWQGANALQASLRGFLFGLGMFGVGVSWVYIAIHDFGQASMLLAALLTALFVSFLASFLAAFSWGIKKLTADNTLSIYDYTLLLPVAWIMFEWFKGWILTGFPWLEVGVSQIDGPLAGFIPFVGALGVSWLASLSAGLILVTIQFRQWWPSVLLILIWGGGQLLQQNNNWTEPDGEPIKATLIQGNIPQAIKWDPDQLFKTLALYQARTEQNWDSDLIVWPENAVTVFYHQAKEFFLDPLTEKARDHQTDILLGLPVMDKANGGYYNSMMLLGSEQAFYHKTHLVPFGDYVPMEWLRGLIKFFDLPMSSFQPGPSEQPLIRAAGQNIGISICYEDVFSSEVLRNVSATSLLVNATNNAWYGNSFAPHQHLQISRTRALETGRPILRATTNGISALIDSKGNIQSQTEQFQEAVLTGKVQPRKGQTPYVTWGRMPMIGLSLLMMLVWAYGRRNMFK